MEEIIEDVGKFRLPQKQVVFHRHLEELDVFGGFKFVLARSFDEFPDCFTGHAVVFVVDIKEHLWWNLSHTLLKPNDIAFVDRNVLLVVACLWKDVVDIAFQQEK